jgi:hypothetical protein
MLRITTDKNGDIKTVKIITRAKLRPAKQRANQKQAKVWAAKVARRSK